MSLLQAERVANAVLYEGYVLYPYRASSAKNQVRWQFGVFMPKGYSEQDGYEPWAMQTETLLSGMADLSLKLRCLQVQARIVDEAVERLGDCITWDEGVEQSLVLSAHTRQLLDRPLDVATTFGAYHEVKEVDGGRIVRQRWPIQLRVHVSAVAVGPSVYRTGVRIENVTPWDGVSDRRIALRQALTGLHVVLSTVEGRFLSLTDPPPGLESAALACKNEHTWPVLIGRDDRTVLSSPIILSDYPCIAPESPGDLCDATEIDEILTLRIQTLTDAEKQEARATDDRARRIIERSDTLSEDAMSRLHGTMRELLDGPSPETATARLGDVVVRYGSRVRLRPRGRADPMDMFMDGQIAVVEGVLRDVDDQTYVAVNLEDDPGADIRRESGRFYYYTIEEVEAIC